MNKNIKHKKWRLTNIAQKHQHCRENNVVFIDWKQNKKQDKKTKQTITKNKTNIETERQKYTPSKPKQK